MRDVFGIIFNFEKKLKIKFLFLFVLIVLLGIANMISVFSIAPVVDTLLEKILVRYHYLQKLQLIL